MISAANINHGLTLALILLMSMVLLIIAGVIGLSSKKMNKKHSNTQAMIMTTLILVGIAGVLYSCTA